MREAEEQERPALTEALAAETLAVVIGECELGQGARRGQHVGLYRHRRRTVAEHLARHQCAHSEGGERRCH